MQARKIITVDGLAGSGKSTLAAQLAARLGWIHFSTGLLYRAVGFLSIENGVDPEDGGALADMLSKHKISVVAGQDASAKVLIDGDDQSLHLHSPEVSEATSRSAQHREVRSELIEPQREAFPGLNLVAEGRDLGTVIYPSADLKLFVETSPETRVARRLKQLYGDTSKLPPERLNSLKRDMQIEIIERDKRDSERALAPAVAAPDALIIDNSAQPLTSVVQTMYDAASQRGLV